jgi:hypothetical protein
VPRENTEGSPKWTPGPWAIDHMDPCGSRDICLGADGDGELLATAYIVNADRGKDDEEETGRFNANLIAAAPDLYAALVVAVEAIEWTFKELGSGTRVEDRNFMKQARAALAKARGEKP